MPSALLPGLAADAWHQADGPGPAAVSWAHGRLGGGAVVVVVWDFAVMGGTFGERDATAWVDACAAAEAAAVPLVAVTSSGGTRVQEGIPGLAGMARATIARERLAAAGVPVIAVVGQPTAGGVWVTVASRADVRIAVRHATVGFAGPRVVEAVTGVHVGERSHTAESALAAGLVDVVLPADDVEAAVVRLLDALAPARAAAVGSAPPPPPSIEDRSPWAAVEAARRPRRWSAGSLLAGLVTDATPLAAPLGDATALAVVGTCGGRGVVGVALAARRHGNPTPDAYRLVIRAAQLADRWGLPLVTLVDTPGADPRPPSEADGLAAAIGDAFAAVLACRSPTLGVLLGEGGSGGALAALVCDAVLRTPESYFAALIPEGAAAALRMSAEDAAAAMALRPEDLDPVCDGWVTTDDLTTTVLWWLARLTAADRDARLVSRTRRWGAPVSK